MNFAECISLSRGNTSGFNTGIKSKSSSNSMRFDRIMEKVLIQKENKDVSINPVKNEIQHDFKAVNEVITEQQQMTEEKSIKPESYPEKTLPENLTKEEIESILDILSGLLNINLQDIGNIRDILNDALNNEAKNEQIQTLTIEELYTVLQGNELLSKEDIDKAIGLVQALKQTSPIAKNSTDESCFAADDSIKIDVPEETQDTQKLSMLNYSMKEPIKTIINKSESIKPNNFSAPNTQNDLIDNKGAIDEEENAKQMGSNYYKNSEINFNSQIKKVDLTEITNTNDNTGMAVNTEFPPYGEISFISADNSKIVPNNIESMDATLRTSKEELFSQIIENSTVFNNEDYSEIRIQLKPDSLGKLTIRLIMEKGEMTAKFVAENRIVKETIESNFSELRDALNQKGLNIQNLSVSVGQQGKWQFENQNFRAWKNNIKRLYKIDNDDLEAETSILDYDNPYGYNNGLVDIKV